MNQENSDGPRRNRRRRNNRSGNRSSGGSGGSGRGDRGSNRPPQRVHRELPTEIDPNKPAPAGSFAQLMPALQCALQNSGYVTPTPVQEQAIPILLNGEDLLATAQTGTGKTAAFTLPMLQRMHERGGKAGSKRPRALILAPTRELAAQIGDSVETYGSHLNLSHTVIFGGVGQNPQVRALNSGIDVLIATPGRLLDLMNQGHIDLSEVTFFILDEVDRMLDMGFIPDIRKVLSKLPRDRQSLFFSATMVKTVEDLALSMTSNPQRIAIDPGTPAVERITQHLYFVDKADKLNLLVNLVSQVEGNGKVVIFTRMKHQANKVSEKLEKNQITAAAIHGNKSQGARTRAMDGFRSGKIRCLVATDIAARGIDVDNVTTVINFDLPMESETYVHRIGRTARAGAEGDAISFCSEEERGLLYDVEKLIGFQIDVVEDHSYHCERARKAPRSNRPQQGGGGRRGGGGGGRRGGGGGGRRPKSPKGSVKSSSTRNSRGGGSGRGGSGGRSGTRGR